MPEVMLKTTTWTRESHGLFDYEVKESERKVLFEKKQFKLKGTHRIYRAESEVTAEFSQGSQFEQDEDNMSQAAKDTIVARLMQREGAYWLFHKNFVDSAADQVLERKPEEKIWRVVREHPSHPEMPGVPSCLIQKRDLIKVGRVRFKIRDAMSPVYREIAQGVDIRLEDHREMFPSVLDESISSALLHPEEAEYGGAEPDDGDGEGDAEDAAALAEAH